MKEIAVAGDILEVCQEYHLDMITIYGRFAMMSSLASEAASELIDKTVETLQKLHSYGWKTRRLVFDAEGSMVAYRRVVEERTQCVVKTHNHDSKVGIIELNNKCIRERVATKHVAMTLDCNSLIMS